MDLIFFSTETAETRVIFGVYKIDGFFYYDGFPIYG